MFLNPKLWDFFASLKLTTQTQSWVELNWGMDNKSWRLNPNGSCSEDVRIGDVVSASASNPELQRGPVGTDYFRLHAPKPDESCSGMSDRLIKTQIANHPLYPNLVSAFLECQKVHHSSHFLMFFSHI